jgi:hypothetical protein
LKVRSVPEKKGRIERIWGRYGAAGPYVGGGQNNCESIRILGVLAVMVIPEKTVLIG